MIPNREQQLNQKELEALNQKNKIASTLIEDASFNTMINKKRAELSDKEFLKWLDQIKKSDQQKLISIKVAGQDTDKLLVNKPKQGNMKQTQKQEQLKSFGQLKQQLELENIQAQIKKNAQKAQNQIDRQRLGEFATKDNSNKKRVEDNQKILEEMLKEKQKEQERQDYFINEEKYKNSKFHSHDQAKFESNPDKLKYQSKNESKAKLLTKPFIPSYKKEL
ncbi:unnamed protein product (macronuclear) [Paramecium tetraurelia]|uniref:Uncharacterized protein n=1 Tax=Paramecium tetraurelia TaxID=5888 RepID=A0CYZ9_PARTE|nr:uncharacterized protein GSPATT00011617001 [Paramecium tetraurelia]CAK76016.1 unnamed protein product [Paramecium tetraurelia]|eukprot:XP_001443413.1 hypothetical protein (macronuclear) [Paramecium tetraurelia strain d4-2]